MWYLRSNKCSNIYKMLPSCVSQYFSYKIFASFVDTVWPFRLWWDEEQWDDHWGVWVPPVGHSCWLDSSQLLSGLRAYMCCVQTLCRQGHSLSGQCSTLIASLCGHCATAKVCLSLHCATTVVRLWDVRAVCSYNSGASVYVHIRASYPQS